MTSSALAPLDVVVTGIGAVGAYGWGRTALSDAISGENGPSPREVDRSAGYHRSGGARTALLATGLDLQPLLPTGAMRRMSPPARFALAAARLALDDAGLGASSRDELARTAVVSGTAFGPSWVTEQLLRQILEKGPEAASPALFTESVANAAAAQVAISLGAHGPSPTITGREASDLQALGEGFRLVRRGAAERALVVVVDEMIPLLHAILDRFGALARPDADGFERALPFEPNRTGALAAEGAVVALLETRAAAEERAARPICSVLACGAGFDPSATAWQYGTDAAHVARSVRRGLDRAALDPASIGLVVAGASGARVGDRTIGRAINELFRERQPAIATPKRRLGEYGGGFLGAALLHAAGVDSATLLDSEIADPEIGLAPPPGGPSAPLRRTLAVTTASGGELAWAVLGAGSEPSQPRGV